MLATYIYCRLILLEKLSYKVHSTSYSVQYIHSLFHFQLLYHLFCHKQLILPSVKQRRLQDYSELCCGVAECFELRISRLTFPFPVSHFFVPRSWFYPGEKAELVWRLQQSHSHNAAARERGYCRQIFVMILWLTLNQSESGLVCAGLSEVQGRQDKEVTAVRCCRHVLASCWGI